MHHTYIRQIKVNKFRLGASCNGIPSRHGFQSHKIDHPWRLDIQAEQPSSEETRISHINYLNLWLISMI